MNCSSTSLWIRTAPKRLRMDSATGSVPSPSWAPTNVFCKGAVEGCKAADTAALWLIRARQVRTVPVQVEGANALTGGVLAADPGEPAVVRTVTGGSVHRPEGVRRLQWGRVRADDDAVHKVAQPETCPRTWARLVS